jgi:hypothetical protein
MKVQRQELKHLKTIYCAMQFVFDAVEGEAMFEYDNLH